MKKLILIKLGGSLITDKNNPFTANYAVLRKLCVEIKTISENQDYLFIVGHGSGSFGHTTAKLYQTQKGFLNEKSPFGMALVQDSAAQLNRIVVKQLLEEQVKAYSVSPSSSVVTKNGKIIRWSLEAIINLLEKGLLPVVYGDVVVDERRGCAITSTEILLNYLALNLKKDYRIEKIIYLGDTDGVWDENGEIIPIITPKIYEEMKKNFGSSKGIDVTGGMEHKMSEAVEIAKTGIEVIIANGNKPGILKKIVSGEKVGTVIKKT
jgi:isopentenyl phosphate kinase